MRKRISRKSKRTKKPSSLNLFQTMLFGIGFYVVCLLGGDSMSGKTAQAQTTAPSRNNSLPFRPIGSQSAVDQYRTVDQYQSGDQYRTKATGNQFFRQSAYPHQPNGNVRQVAMQSGGFALPQNLEGGSPPSAPPNQFSPPPLNTPPALQPQTLPSQPPQFQQAPSPLRPSAPPLSSPPISSQPTVPNSFPQPGMAPSTGPLSNSPPPRSLPNYQAPPMADYQPLAPPQITNGGFATMGDCRLISAPSNYTAMSPYGSSAGCGVSPASFNGAYVPPPAQIAAPATMPPAGMVPFTQSPGSPVTGGLANSTAAPVGSLMTFGQENYPVQVGQGLWGQPVAYVPGQSFRNWLRYLSF